MTIKSNNRKESFKIFFEDFSKLNFKYFKEIFLSYLILHQQENIIRGNLLYEEIFLYILLYYSHLEI